MKNKVVFLDIDGTMVCFDGVIPESAKRAIRMAKDNGHKMVICTGRSYFQIYPELLALGFDGVVCGAGVCVKSKNKEIFHAFISEEQKKKSFDYLEQNQFLFCYQGTGGLVINKRSMDGISDMFLDAGMSEEQLKQLQGNLTVREDIWNHPELEKIIYYKAPYPIEVVHEQMLPYFDAVKLSLDGADEFCGEVGINGIHKATGMQKYLEYIGVPQEDTIAIGDGPNDLQMMEYAATAVAMGNAVQDVKDRADYVTWDVDKDGIYHAFEHLGLI